jgi:hypothetical protein
MRVHRTYRILACSPLLPLLTLFDDSSRVFGASLLAQQCSRYAEQRARAQQGQMVWLQGLGVSQFKAVEVLDQHDLSNSTTCCSKCFQIWGHSGTSALPPCSNEKFNGDMDAVLDDLCSTKGDGGNSIICQNCTKWLQ